MLGFPLPIDQLKRLEALLDEAEALLRPYGLFYADSLLTVGRMIGFLEDPSFRNALMSADPTRTFSVMAWRIHVLCWAATLGLKQPGDLVECGVLEGFSMDAVARYVDLEQTGRGLYLYDLFDGAGGVGRGVALPQHDSDLAWRVEQRFKQYSRAKVVAGFVPDSFQIAVPEQICFLHIDLNDADAETAALDSLWDRLSPGAAIVYDDFGWRSHAAQHAAATRAMAERGVSILELPTGQGLAIKP
ncbi:MAG: TylF/MycF/NovP-related O-methyltransferase [Alphaproteobacteria bacterium]|nr:TylF/MycF/NovP-related O-methyltransferase [Alphaproteobacteria bacterium]